MKNKMLIVVLLLVGAVAMAGQTATAETINFGSLAKFEGASDLDLSGDFLYTTNITPDTTAPVINGLTFTPNASLAGLSVTSANSAANWVNKPEYGASSDDDALEDAMHDMRYSSTGSGADLNIDADVISGQQYKLQLLFSENFYTTTGSRSFDISIEGSKAVDEFDIINTAGTWTGAPTAGTVFTYIFTAGDTNLDIDLEPGTSFSDHAPLINGMTLEKVPEPASIILFSMAGFGLLMARRRRENG